jgi:ribosomal protein S6
MSQTHEEIGEKLTSYELGYHLVPSLGEQDLALRVDELVKVVTHGGGRLISEGAPQQCNLAYTMRKQRGGKWDAYNTSFFGWLRFEADPKEMAYIKDELDHTEHLIRYLLITLDDAALAAPGVMLANASADFSEVTVTKELEKKQVAEEKAEVSEEELDKEIEHLIGSDTETKDTEKKD